MIKEDYVSFEVAKRLKEKGFNEPCNGRYSYRGGNVIIENYPISNESLKYHPNIDGISAPTLQMAIKWLEVEHRLLILKDYVNVFNSGFWYRLSVMKIKEDGSIDDVFESYCIHDKDYNNGCNRIIKYCLKQFNITQQDMAKYIEKATLVAELERRRSINSKNKLNLVAEFEDNYLLSFIDELEEKEV